MTTMTKTESKPSLAAAKELLASDADGLRKASRRSSRAEITQALGAAMGERSETRLGHCSGNCARGLITRLGKIELKVPKDRQARFST
jgi:putative transposase